METIIEFNNWLNSNDYKIDGYKLNEDLIDEIINVHKYKSGGRNELDKYMKILITKYDLLKDEEKVLNYKELVTEFKKERKTREKKILKNEKKTKDTKEKRKIELIANANTDKLVYIDKVENICKNKCVDVFEDSDFNKKEWKIRIEKKLYKLKLEGEMILIYGKKMVKRDIKLLNDTFQNKIKRKKKIDNLKDEIKKQGEETESKEENVKEDIHEENLNENSKDNVVDKKKIYKELFGEDSDEENDDVDNESTNIDDLVIDLEDIKF